MSDKKVKVVHLIPRDGLGGTEAAARSLDEGLNPGAEVWFMSGRSLSNKKNIREIRPNSKLSDPRIYFSAFLSLLKVRPELVVCSLWRATVVALLYKFVFPFRSFVVFLHSEKYAHLIDKVVTSIAMRLAKEIWCDSEATLKSHVPKKMQAKARVLSLLLKVEPCNEEDIIKKAEFKFVYWGRLSKTKQVHKAIEIFYFVKKEIDSARFYIYGPEEGSEKPRILREIESKSLSDSVVMMGEKPPGEFCDNICSSSFFFNVSKHEGMAVAVIEAMQLGLVPIVTPVGEVKSYCSDGGNAVFVDAENPRESAEKLLSIVKDKAAVNKLSASAFLYWKEKEDYSSEFSSNCSRLLLRNY